MGGEEEEPERREAKNKKRPLPPCYSLKCPLFCSCHFRQHDGRSLRHGGWGRCLGGWGLGRHRHRPNASNGHPSYCFVPSCLPVFLPFFLVFRSFLHSVFPSFRPSIQAHKNKMSATPHAREGWKSKIVTITVIICTIQAVCTHA